jgi:hypothetical protein
MELWKLSPGEWAFYCDDPERSRRIRRKKRPLPIMAEYFKDGKRIAVQYWIDPSLIETVRRWIQNSAE